VTVWSSEDNDDTDLQALQQHAQAAELAESGAIGAGFAEPFSGEQIAYLFLLRDGAGAMIGCVGMVSAIVLISVRGVWVSLAGGASLWIFAMRDRVHGALRVLAVSSLLTVLVVLLALVLFPSQFELIRGHTVDKLQMSLRFDTWNTFLALSLKRPFLGHGLDDQAMSRHYHEAFTRERGTAPAELNPTTPHNQFIKIFYQQGLIGLLLYLVLLALALRTLYRAFQTGPPGIASLLPLALASVVLAEYVLHCLIEDRSLTPLGVLIGVAGACLSREHGG
jgi:O-antigen ligase